MRKGNVKTHVTPKGWDVKGGIPPTACWRLGCGEARQTLKHDRAIPKTTAVQGRERHDEIVLGMCAAQCGSMEAKALSFVLRARVYVCSGRAGGNERHLLFYARSEESYLCSLLIYTPSSVRHQPRRNRCVFLCKMRLGFISTVNLREMYVSLPPCFFSCKMRVAFILIVNLFATPANVFVRFCGRCCALFNIQETFKKTTRGW